MRWGEGEEQKLAVTGLDAADEIHGRNRTGGVRGSIEARRPGADGPEVVAHLIQGGPHYALALLLRTTSGGDERRRGSGSERCVDGNHRRAAGVDGVDDLGAVDALKVDRG